MLREEYEINIGCYMPKPCSVSCVQASELFKGSMTEQQLKLEEASI